MHAPLTILALAAGTLAHAGTITQVVPFDYDPNLAFAFPEFTQFDTQGGTRELLSVELSYDQTISFEVRAEQNSPVPLPADNFFAFIDYLSLHQLGTVDEALRGGGGDPPFLGPGAYGISISPALGPTDGFNGTGPDTYSEVANSGLFNFTAAFLAGADQNYIDAFIGTGILTTVLGGFTEIFGGFNEDPGFPAVDPNNPPEGNFSPFEDPYYGVFLDFFNFRHQGTITATYQYRLIPTPAAATLLLTGATLLTPRRRR